MFALCLIDRGASVHSFKVIKLRKMKDIINKILNYSLLAAKNVLTLEDVSLLTGLSKSHLYKTHLQSSNTTLQTQWEAAVL